MNMLFMTTIGIGISSLSFTLTMVVGIFIIIFRDYGLTSDTTVLNVETRYSAGSRKKPICISHV